MRDDMPNETSDDQLRRLGRRFYEAFDRNRPELLDDVLAADWHPRPPVPGNPGGRAGQQGTLAYLHQVFADLRYAVEDVVVAGDTVVCRAVLSGRQVGEFLGVPPTGRAVRMTTIEIHRVRDGRISETWHLEDFFGAYRQLTAPDGG